MRTDHIVKLARKYTDYEMISKHTNIPVYPEARARLLYAFMLLNPAEAEHSEVCSLATSLAQLGLDTHDLVNGALNQELIGQARSRQLKVLAGDYYNSRFYQLLAQIGRVDIIRLVSTAISEVNRLKMNFYERFRTMKLTAVEYMSQSVSMKSKLFLALTRFIPESYQTKWTELLSIVVQCEIIHNELERNDVNETFRDSWAFCYLLSVVSPAERERLLHIDKPVVSSLMSKYNIHGILVDMLHSYMQQATQILEQLDSESLRTEVMSIVQIFNSSSRLQHLVKEI
jgi:heptaprenyl diphosphate synthase